LLQRRPDRRPFIGDDAVTDGVAPAAELGDHVPA
jgi:hypothetical protein